MLGLTVVLAVQWLVASRNQLAADARWRALVTPVCGVLGCPLPDWHEPEAFHLLARDVQPHPARGGVLRITATFRNEGAWAQPWPVLVVHLTGSDGAVVGARAFTPREYLGARPEQRLVDPGQQASIALDIRQPDTRAVAFDFALR